MNIISLIDSLNEHDVRYIVAGGVAVNLHGVERATADLDLVIDFEPKNVEKFVKVMNSLGYEPKVPVKAIELADPEKRAKWMDEKGMLVFSFWHRKQPLDIVDVFVFHPIPYDDMNVRKMKIKAGQCVIPIASIDDLVTMKKQAGRKQDVADIAALTQVKKLRRGNK